MKKYRVISVVILALIILIAFNYAALLRGQNDALSVNIDQITKKITLLELDKTMQQVSLLKAKNIALKAEVEDLRRQLSRISKNIAQQSSPVVKQDKKRIGNKGFLIKDSKPTQ